MCTVIKVKRKITDDPVDCLILECKKRKKQFSEEQLTKKLIESDERLEKSIEESLSDENRIDSIKQVLKYAGSAKNDHEISERLIELSTNLKSTVNNFVKHPKTPTPSKKKEKNLKQTKKEVKSHRYVLLNKKRGVEALDNETIENITNKDLSLDKTEIAINNYGDMNILDVVSSDVHDEENLNKNTKQSERFTCNGVELIQEKVNKKQNEYVYDIYYAKNLDIHLDLLYPDNFTINSFDLEFDDNIQEEPEEFYEDDEDSNDEGNWRNDYPDEDDDIDDENDDDGIRTGYMTNHDNGECYNEYDEEGDYKLSAILRKSCNLDRSYYEDEENSDDYEEYDDEDSKSYSAYKRRLIKELEK